MLQNSNLIHTLDFTVVYNRLRVEDTITGLYRFFLRYQFIAIQVQDVSELDIDIANETTS
jgi:hypothetical protein